MKNMQQMLDLLEQKRTYLLHYEKELEALPLLPAQELEACVLRGELIVEKLKELDGKLGGLLRQNGAAAMSAVNHDCDRGQLDPELGRLYDAALEVKAVANRIVQNNSVIKERIALEREKALEGIRDVSKRSASVAGRYRQTTEARANTVPERMSRDV